MFGRSPSSPVSPQPNRTTLSWKHILIIAKCAVSLGILCYLFYNASQGGQWEQLSQTPKHWGWVAMGFFGCLAAMLFSFYRWQLLVRALELPFRLIDSIRIGFIGLFFGLFAFGVVGNDSLRAFYAARQAKDRVSAAVTSVLADRIIGLLTMFTIATLAFCSVDFSTLAESYPEKARALSVVGWFVMACTGCGYLGLAVLCFTPMLKKTRLFQWFVGLPKIGGILEKVSAAVVMYRGRPGVIVASFGLSAAVNFCFLLSMFSLAKGLTSGHPTLLEHMVIEPLAMVSNAAPLPGGIGGLEFAMKFLYVAFNSDNGVVVGFAFRIAFLLVSAIGAVVWFANRETVASLKESATEV